MPSVHAASCKLPRLLPWMVAGLLFLVVAVPAPAQDTDAGAVGSERIINPSANVTPVSQAPRADGAPLPSPSVALVYVVILGAAAFFLYRQVKKGGLRSIGSGGRGSIHIQSTRVLGNRQHLVIAEVEGRKMLLGVGPGFISHLADLGTAEATGQADTDEADAIQDLPPVEQKPTHGQPFSALLGRIEGFSRNRNNNNPS